MICIDITEMIKVNYISGIQRVVKEITLRWIEKGVDMTLLYYDPGRKWFWVVDLTKYYSYYTGKLKQKKLLTRKKMKIDEFGQKHIFFDMDSVWMSPLKRSWLFPVLRKQGVQIAVHIYDVIPITEPFYCHEFTTICFMEYLGAQLKYADLIISNAQATVYALNKIIEQTEVQRINAKVVKLGSDLKQYTYENEVRERIKKIAQAGKYVLMVGTVEPRKNHKFVLESFEQKLFQDDVNLVFVGRMGWNIETWAASVKRHKQLNKKLFWIEDAVDAEIAFLYENALVVAFPSYNEGFGLPIVEAINKGALVLSSDIPVLREAGGEYCKYFSLDNKEEFETLVQYYNSNSAEWNRDKEKLKQYTAYSWDECATDILSSLYTGLGI